MKNKLMSATIAAIMYVTIVQEAASQQNVYPSVGNVGLGTTAPSEKLHVNGNIIVEGLAAPGLGIRPVYVNDQGKLVRGDFTNPGGGNVGNGPGGGNQVCTDTPWQYILTTNSSPNKTILCDLLSNVGIGTANPTEKLTVNGNLLLNNGNILMPSLANSAVQQLVLLPDGTVDVATLPTTQAQWLTNADHIYAPNTGNVGIGTSNPLTKLHVSGNGTFEGTTHTLTLKNATTNNYTTFHIYSNYSEIASYSGSTNRWTPLVLQKEGSYVAIGCYDGTYTGDYKLFVNGAIKAKKVRVDVHNWCDYVFEQDYKLMPLSELERYLKTQKHLPEIPTTAEVKNAGIDIVEMNALLLKKIEELTLYVIEQDKRIKDLESK